MKAIYQILCLGIFYCLLITTYTSFSYIVTYIYEDLSKQGFKQMGPLLLGANYFCFLLTNSFAPGINIRLKNQLKIAALCYSFSYFVEIFNLQKSTLGIILSVIGAMTGGFGAAIVWVCYGAYTKSLCKLRGQQHLQGNYFALLSAITFSSSIFGPVITTFCLGYLNSQIYFVILTCLGVGSFVFCIFAVDDIDSVTKLDEHIQWKEMLLKNCQYYKQMRSLIALLILDGVSLGFLSASVTKIIPQPETAIKNGVFLIILGIGSIIGAFFSGYLSDQFSMKNVGRSTVLITFLNCCLTFLAIFYPNLIFCYFCAFTWGISLQYLQGWVYVACSRNFKGNLSAYANQKQVHSMSFCVYQIILITTLGKVNLLYILLFMVVWSPVAFLSLNKLPDSGRQPTSPSQVRGLKQNEEQINYQINIE